MANLTKTKMEEIYKLLSEQKWKTVFNGISDKYKCGICKNVLINAHQTFCGCNFCYECISQYIENGAEICPGNTEECKLEINFKNIMINYGLNKEVSKLVVICPNEMCFHECQLINFGEHLKNCLNTLTNCPFDCVGCAHKPMKSDKINEHLLSEINKHSTVLIDFIKNLKNDIEELKSKEECNKLEIEKLKKNDRTKDMNIESMKTYIKSIKKDYEAVREQMEIGDRNLWNRFDEICNTMNQKSINDVIVSIDNEIKLLKKDNEVCREQIEIGDQKLWIRFDEICYTMKQKCNNDVIVSIDNEIKLLKKDNEALTEQMEIRDRNLWIQFNEICSTMNQKSNNDVVVSIDNEIKLLKIEKEKLLQQIKSIENYIDEKFINAIRNEWNEKLHKTLNSIKQENNESQSNILSRISKIDKFLNIRHCGVLWWHIGQLNNIGLIWSECFYDKKKPYKMKLELRNESGDLHFFLVINSTEFDEDLKWPCKVRIVIVFYALNDYQRKKSFDEERTIGKPKRKSAEYSSAIKLPWSFYNCREFANHEQFSVKCFVEIL